jgi:hypothetical protein
MWPAEPSAGRQAARLIVCRLLRRAARGASGGSRLQRPHDCRPQCQRVHDE